ncbi:PASTA domain-containing protein [Micromonospora sp. CPCC 205561]|uniref:PASTA domain-containing protein n=1 Tax=Micromonospora sp. CPCC 205561 TaxID=3122407 RepID=UPI002FEED853
MTDEYPDEGTGARDDAGPGRSGLLLRGGLAVVLLAAVGATGGWLLAGGEDRAAPPTMAESLPTGTPSAARPSPARSTPAAPPKSPPTRSAGLTVPPLVGEDFTEARDELRERRLGWRLVFGGGVGRTVERTSPEVGTEVRPGRTVTLYVSGPAPAATVPDVVGDDCGDGADELVDEGFYPQYRSGRQGTVTRQDPAGESTGRWNDQVSVWCGDDPEDGGSASPTP